MGGYNVSRWDGKRTVMAVAFFSEAEGLDAAKADALERSRKDPGVAYQVLGENGAALYSAISGKGEDCDPDSTWQP
jgi:hypothetical protein